MGDGGDIFDHGDDQGFGVAPLHPLGSPVDAPLSGKAEPAVAPLAERGEFGGLDDRFGVLLIMDVGKDHAAGARFERLAHQAGVIPVHPEERADPRQERPPDHAFGALVLPPGVLVIDPAKIESRIPGQLDERRAETVERRSQGGFTPPDLFPGEYPFQVEFTVGKVFDATGSHSGQVPK